MPPSTRNRCGPAGGRSGPLVGCRHRDRGGVCPAAAAGHRHPVLPDWKPGPAGDDVPPDEAVPLGPDGRRGKARKVSRFFFFLFAFFILFCREKKQIVNSNGRSRIKDHSAVSSLADLD